MSDIKKTAKTLRLIGLLTMGLYFLWGLVGDYTPYDFQVKKFLFLIAAVGLGLSIAGFIFDRKKVDNFKTKTVLKAPSLSRIKKVENYCKCVLPNDYKEFIRLYNGAVPEGTWSFRADRERVLEGFLSIVDQPNEDEGGSYDILVVEAQVGERLVKNPDGVGCELLPIGKLFSGDLLCLDFTSRNPKVVVWSHAESGLFSPKTYFVANSFSDFLHMLKESPTNP